MRLSKPDKNIGAGRWCVDRLLEAADSGNILALKKYILFFIIYYPFFQNVYFYIIFIYLFVI